MGVGSSKAPTPATYGAWSDAEKEAFVSLVSTNTSFRTDVREKLKEDSTFRAAFVSALLSDQTFRTNVVNSIGVDAVFKNSIVAAIKADAAFVELLKGGPQGPPGTNGTNGTNGLRGETGLTGPAGKDSDVSKELLKTNSLWCADGGVCTIPATFNLEAKKNVYVDGEVHSRDRLYAAKGIFTGTGVDSTLGAEYNGAVNIKNDDKSWTHIGYKNKNYLRGDTTIDGMAGVNNNDKKGVSIMGIGISGETSGYIFKNGSQRTEDGGANAMTIRNDKGDLRLGAVDGKILITNGTEISEDTDFKKNIYSDGEVHARNRLYVAKGIFTGTGVDSTLGAEYNGAVNIKNNNSTWTHIGLNNKNQLRGETELDGNTRMIGDATVVKNFYADNGIFVGNKGTGAQLAELANRPEFHNSLNIRNKNGTWTHLGLDDKNQFRGDTSVEGKDKNGVSIMGIGITGETFGYIFKNGSERTEDGGPNTMTIRNDKGNLRLGAVDGIIYTDNQIKANGGMVIGDWQISQEQNGGLRFQNLTVNEGYTLAKTTRNSYIQERYA